MASPELFAVWLFKNVSSLGCTRAGGEAEAQTIPNAAPGPRVSRPSSAATSNRPPPHHAGCSPPPPQPKSLPHPALTARRESLVFAAKIKSKWKGKVRRFQAEQPDSSREGKKALSKRGRKSELQGNADSNAEKIFFCARRGAELGEAGPGSRFARARWRGSAPGASNRAGRAERSRCGLQDAFGAVRLAGCRKRERSELGSFGTSSTLPRNGSPRRRSEPARERCCQEARGGNRERKSFSLITTSSPYLQYKGETK